MSFPTLSVKMNDQQKRTTSAGYRMPVGNTSSVHRAVTRPATAQPAGGLKKAREVEKCDEVSFNKIWREQIVSEWKGVHDW